MKIIKEDINIPSKGKADGYQGTMKIAPTENCKGIPEDLLKFIRRIYDKNKRLDLSHYQIINNEVYAVEGPVDYLVIEYLFDNSIHTTSISKNNEIQNNREVIKNNFIKGLQNAGWKIMDD